MVCADFFTVGLYIIWKQKKQRFFNILEQVKLSEQERLEQLSGLNHKVAEEQEHGGVAEEVAALQETTDTLPMGEGAIKKLLTGLAEFECSALFIEKNVSLPFVASYIGTNTKYLSRIINLCKHKDFSSYINELRINYVIEKLQQDPQ